MRTMSRGANVFGPFSTKLNDIEAGITVTSCSI